MVKLVQEEVLILFIIKVGDQYKLLWDFFCVSMMHGISKSNRPYYIIKTILQYTRLNNKIYVYQVSCLRKIGSVPMTAVSRKGCIMIEWNKNYWSKHLYKKYLVFISSCILHTVFTSISLIIDCIFNWISMPDLLYIHGEMHLLVRFTYCL